VTKDLGTVELLAKIIEYAVVERRADVDCFSNKSCAELPSKTNVTAVSQRSSSASRTSWMA